MTDGLTSSTDTTGAVWMSEGENHISLLSTWHPRASGPGSCCLSPPPLVIDGSWQHESPVYEKDTSHGPNIALQSCHLSSGCW